MPDFFEVSPRGHIDESENRKMSWLPVEERVELRLRNTIEVYFVYRQIEIKS